MAHTRSKQPQMLREAFREMMKGVATSTPGHILAFDPVTQLAQVQIGIVRVDLNGAKFDPPAIIETPVYFPGGAYHVEYQLDPGDEGDILFSQRCIDGWLQTGGIAENPIGRFHDPQDAFFLPGFRSLPNALPAFQNNGIRLSNLTGTQFMWLKQDGSMAWENGSGFIRIGADGTVNINGVTIDVASLVTTPNDVKAGTIQLKTHRHTGVTAGTATSGIPTP
jgi:hypothetical protein